MRVSKSSLDAFKRCARCWWMEKNHDIKIPQGIRAGVPMGIDRVLKWHYDNHRAAGTTPPELAGQIPGGLYPGDRISLGDLRNWRKGLTAIVDGVELSTAMDDLLFDPKTGIYNVIDAKSKAKLTNEEDTRKYYQTQADCYTLALDFNKYKVDSDCFFAYYSPIEVAPSQPSSVVPFKWNCQVVKITANIEDAKALVIAAAKCWQGPEPAADPECEYCNHHSKLTVRENQGGGK